MTIDGMLIRLRKLTRPCGWRCMLLTALLLTVLLAATCLPAISDPLLTIQCVPAAGGTTTGGGTYVAGAPVSLTATPNTGYSFIGWTTDPAGLSPTTAFNYTMPATDTTLYAQFSTGATLFSDNFESYADASLIEDQGWWKVDYPNGNGAGNQRAYSSNWSIPQLPGSTRYSAGQAVYDWDSDAINLPFHLGSGNLTGNIIVDWDFYDPKGTAGGLSDTLCLSACSGITSAADIVSGGAYTWQQRFSVGMQAGFDNTKYQVRCLGRTDGVNTAGWFNTSKPRSVGWHEGTIIVGAPESDGSNLITVLIDGTNVWQKNSTSKVGYNLLETNSAYVSGGFIGAYDNIRIISHQLPSVTGLVVTANPAVPKTISATWATTFADHSLVQVDNGLWQDPATSPATLTVTTYGTHTVNVKAVNADGQAGPVVSASVLVDMPITGLAVAPNPVAPTTPAVASWSCVATPDHYMVQIDGGTWSQQTSPYTFDTTGMVYGSHTITVKAVDAGGSEGTPSTVTFLVDRSILTWNILGHYPWEGPTTNPDGSTNPGLTTTSTRFATDFFAPATTEAIAGAKTGLSYPSSAVQPTYSSWTPYTSPNPTVDLNVVYNTVTAPNTEFGVTYLCTYILNSGSDITNAYFTCGSDDGNKIFVNGVPQVLVSSVTEPADTGTVGHNVYRGCRLNDDLYGPFTIKAGGNKLLFKLTQGGTGYQMQGQLCDATKHELPAVTSGRITYAVSDDTPPTGTVSINGGAATASSFNVTLTLTATDALNPLTQMAFSNDGFSFDAPRPFAATANWVLSDGAGPKTVYAKLIDSCGNESIVSDDIIVPSGWTITVINCDNTAGNPAGAGVYTNGASVTLTANPFPGYSFIGWSDINTGCLPPGQTTPVVSPSATYTFTAHNDVFLFANYKANTYVMAATACANGTTTGSGNYTTASSVTVTATPNANYRFKNWTSDSCGGTAVVSTNASYTFNMPPNNYTLYANFEYIPMLTLVSVPTAGGTATGGGARYNLGSTVALSATTNTGYSFLGWTTDRAGLNPVTVPVNVGGTNQNVPAPNPSCPNYVMPATDTTLYAQFGPVPTFYDDFEGRNLAYLEGQSPWYTDWAGTAAGGNQKVFTTAYSVPQLLGSTKYETAQVANDWDATGINLAYRFGGNARIPGNIVVNWWFYDPGNNANFKDTLALSNVTGMPLDHEPTSNAGLSWGTGSERMQLGASNSTASGLDTSKYQGRAFNVVGFGGSSWFNTSTTRSKGWHQGKFIVGPSIGGTSNLVDMYIDNKQVYEGAVTSGGGYDTLELNDGFGTAPGAKDNVAVYLSITTPYVTGFAITPTTTILDTTPVTVTWTANNADHSEMQIDNGAWVVATSPSTIDTTHIYGTHTVSVRCLNADGQSSPTVSASFTVDHSSIRTWATIGSYAKSGTTPIDTEYFAPTATDATVFAHVGGVINGCTWKSYTSPTRDVNFDLVYGSNHTNCVSYLFNYVMNSGSAISNAYVTGGSDDGIVIYVNGVRVWRNDAARGVVIDQDISAGFTLNPGLNTLLIKETQGTGGEGVQARLCDAARNEPAWLSQLTYVQSDDTAPTGTIKINGGAATTGNPSVTLTLSATDNMTGVKSMQFSNDNVTYGAPVAYATSASYTLPDPDGAKTVYVEFIDGAGNVSSPVSATITLSRGPQAPPACTEKAKISDLWPLANDATVYGLDNANAKTVTAVWSDGFWVEETSRYAGIKVLVTGGTYKYFDDGTKSAVNVGDVVDIYGNLSVTAGNDRVFNASYVRDRTVGAGTAIAALGVTQRYIVGKQASANTPGLASGKGIYSAGLFVKLAGAVLNPGAGNFFLDDKTYLPGTGIQVFCGTLSVPASGNKVVTGVVGMLGNVPVIYATNIQ